MNQNLQQPDFVAWYNRCVEPFNGSLAVVSRVLASEVSVGPEVFPAVARLMDVNILLIISSLAGNEETHLAVRAVVPFQALLRTVVLFYRELAGSGHFEPVLVGGHGPLEPDHPFIAFIQRQPFYASVCPYPGAEDSDAPAEGGVVAVCGRFNFLIRADPLLELPPAGRHIFLQVFGWNFIVSSGPGDQQLSQDHEVWHVS